jgi:hypothetical protein
MKQEQFIYEEEFNLIVEETENELIEFRPGEGGNEDDDEDGKPD